MSLYKITKKWKKWLSSIAACAFLPPIDRALSAVMIVSACFGACNEAEALSSKGGRLPFARQVCVTGGPVDLTFVAAFARMAKQACRQ